MRVSLFSSLSLVNVWLLNDGLFVVCFHQMQSLKPFHYTHTTFGTLFLYSLLPLFSFHFFIGELGSFFSYGTALFFFSSSFFHILKVF